MAGTSIKRALILGGADCVHADYVAALALFKPDSLFACNHAGRDFEDVDHWITMHPDIRDRLWIPQRARQGFAPVPNLWHPRHRGTWSGSTPIESQGGSSGMLCITVAMHLGFDKIVLAGVPMTKAAKHYDDPKPWHEARQYHNVWNRHAPKLQGRVKSLSGWTRELLGEPTESWINADAGGTP